jgi:hypothetical protein
MRDLNPHSMDYESTALTVKLIALTFLIDLTHTPMCKFSNHQSEMLYEKSVTGIRTMLIHSSHISQIHHYLDFALDAEVISNKLIYH